MENRNLERNASSVSGIIDDLITEIETLEGILSERDTEIERLNEEVEELGRLLLDFNQ